MRRGDKTFGAWILSAMPGTKSQIAKLVGMDRGAAGARINLLHADNKIHIMSWVKSPNGKGRIAAVYMLGCAPDAICKVKPLTRRQIESRHRTKAIADGRWELKMAKDRARWWTKKSARSGDPLVNALFGRSA